MLNHNIDDITIEILKSIDTNHHDYAEEMTEGLMCRDHEVKKFALQELLKVKNDAVTDVAKALRTAENYERKYLIDFLAACDKDALIYIYLEINHLKNKVKKCIIKE